MSRLDVVGANTRPALRHFAIRCMEKGGEGESLATSSIPDSPCLASTCWYLTRLCSGSALKNLDNTATFTWHNGHSGYFVKAQKRVDETRKSLLDSCLGNAYLSYRP
jgi:hypothetical protein